MVADRNSGSTSPVTWAGSYPIYVSTLLAGGYAIMMAVTAIAMWADAGWHTGALSFSAAAVREHGAIWQFATYAFINPPSFLLLLELYMLVIFGRQIEGLLGRRAFAAIYLALLLLPPAALTAASFAGLGIGALTLSGSGAIHFAIFVTFAALCPSAEIFFGLQARWVAAFLVAFSILQELAYRDAAGLTATVLDCGAAILLARGFLRGWRIPSLGELFPARAKRPRLEIVRQPEKNDVPSVDAILEKISHRGLSGLTASERRILEKAREELLEKERKR